MPPNPFRAKIQYYDGEHLFLEGSRECLPLPKEGQTLYFTNQADQGETEFVVQDITEDIPYREIRNDDGTVRREPLMGWATIVQMQRVGR